MQINKYWWVLGLVGLLFMGLGVGVLVSENFTLRDFMLYTSIALLIIGAVLAVGAYRQRLRSPNWWAWVLLGVVQLAVAALILRDLDQAGRVFGYIIGTWAALIGLSQLIVAMGRNTKTFFFVGAGVISLVLAALILFDPFPSKNSLPYLVAFYSVLLGGFLSYSALRISRAK